LVSEIRERQSFYVIFISKEGGIEHQQETLVKDCDQQIETS
jgi:hypothetical protein